MTPSFWPEASASARRCGHSNSTGGTAMKSGPGKSPRWPMPAWPIASSAARVAKRSDRAGAQNGSAAMKSIVPAIFVRRPSLGKRVMAWMPERPAVTADQFSAWPWPSEVTIPMPVTATSGRPLASRMDLLIAPSP